MQYGTTDAATACNVTLNTIRTWAKDYSAFLSAGATGESGQRVFTARDLEVLKYVAQLRSERMQKGAILQRLDETTFSEIDTPLNTTNLAIANAPDPPDLTPAPIVTPEYLISIQHDIEALKAAVTEGKRNQRDNMVVFVAGFLAACGLFILLLLIFLARHWL